MLRELEVFEMRWFVLCLMLLAVPCFGQGIYELDGYVGGERLTITGAGASSVKTFYFTATAPVVAATDSFFAGALALRPGESYERGVYTEFDRRVQAFKLATTGPFTAWVYPAGVSTARSIYADTNQTYCEVGAGIFWTEGYPLVYTFKGLVDSVSIDYTTADTLRIPTFYKE